MAAAAQRHSCPSGQSKWLALLIHNLKVTLDANRTVTEHRYFGCGHKFPPFSMKQIFTGTD
jgi:hypothetical protein